MTGYATCTNGPAMTFTLADLEKLGADMRRMQSERDEIDRGFRVALRKVINESKLSIVEWAERLAVSLDLFVSVVYGAGAVPAGFWNAARAYFEPMRGPVAISWEVMSGAPFDLSREMRGGI